MSVAVSNKTLYTKPGGWLHMARGPLFANFNLVHPPLNTSTTMIPKLHLLRYSWVYLKKKNPWPNRYGKCYICSWRFTMLWTQRKKFQVGQTLPFSRRLLESLVLVPLNQRISMRFIRICSVYFLIHSPALLWRVLFVTLNCYPWCFW